MHTNSADAGLPHISLTDHIADLEHRQSQIVQISDELAITTSVETKARLIRLIRALAA